MKIADVFKKKRPVFSFEFFPPKTESDAAALFQTARDLKNFGPDFISVTWGAGGSTRQKTLDITSAIKKDLGVEPMAHLTCVGASTADIDAVLNEINSRGIENILALRGDPPKGEAAFTPHAEGFRFANELVAHIRQKGGFCLGVAGYPEGHPENPDKEKDLENLKRKVDAGAAFVTTQLFFDNTAYFRFVERARKIGITVPLLPGLMPVTNVKQIERFTSVCGATLPKALFDRLELLRDDAEAVTRFGVEWATRQSLELLQGGAPGIHFYTMNRSRSTAAILKNIKPL